MRQIFHIRPARQQPIFEFGELSQFRHLFLGLVWRTLRVRYQQTVIGVGWALLQPILMTFVFAIIFGRLAGMPSNGQPYPIFITSGLIVWIFVSQSFASASGCMVANAHLITKIYFPKVILILAAITASIADFLCSFVLLLLMMAWYGIAPSIGTIVFIPMMLLAAMTVLGLSLWLSALHVHYRDVGHLLPFLVQLWMFLSPVIYPSSLLPAKYLYLYALNPIGVVIDSCRWAFAGGPPVQANVIFVGIGVALTLCISGYWFFRRMEATFADIV